VSTAKVSVITPVHNRATKLGRAIRSVQAQTMTNWELIVVDDASTDDTPAFVESIADPRIRLLRHHENRGPSVARQTGIDAARGEFIALLDSDDEWLPDKLARQLSTGAAVVACGCFEIVDGIESEFIHPPVENWVEHLHFCSMLRAGSTLLARRDAVISAGGFDPGLRYYEDWDLVLRLAEATPITLVPEALARIHVTGLRSMQAAEPSVRRFLEKHEVAFRRIGNAHRRQVRGQHFQNLAAGAFAERQFGAGAKWLIESFVNNPLQNPIRLAALGLAPIDALCGTSLIAKAAGMRRSKQ
jgi:glycosyltransferase involved in cell wall biosynthesis